MPGMDLSTLNSEQLRNILDAARARNQQDLTEDVLSELEARRARAPGRRIFEREPVGEEQPEAWWEDLRQEAELEPAPASPGRAPAILGVLGAVVLSAGLGWWLSAPHGPRVQGSAGAVPPPAVETMQLAPGPPVAPVEPPRRLAEPAPPAPPPLAMTARTAPIPRAETATPTPSRTRLAARAPSKPADPCRAEATPADRLVCGSPTLTAQHREMREAYTRALKAGVDPLMIDREQAEWRAIRNEVKDPSKLATLYNRRIRELDAAARAADDDPPI